MDVLGFQIETRFEPVNDRGGDYMSRTFDIHPRSSYQGAFLITNSGQRIELPQWQSPDRNTHIASLADMGSRHIAFAVDDLTKTASYLANQPGVDVFEISKYGFFYFRTPWGMYLQAVQHQT